MMNHSRRSLLSASAWLSFRPFGARVGPLRPDRHGPYAPVRSFEEAVREASRHRACLNDVDHRETFPRRRLRSVTPSSPGWRPGATTTARSPAFQQVI
jgi:hypothetical protein